MYVCTATLQGKSQHSLFKYRYLKYTHKYKFKYKYKWKYTYKCNYKYSIA